MAEIIQFRPGALAGALAVRGPSPDLAAKRDLERYYALLERALRTVQLTEGEAALLCDAGNGTLWEPHTIPLLWAEVEDAIQLNGLAAKWGVDGAALVAKLRALDTAQTFALADAIERFWRLAGDNERPLGDVGLVR